MKIAIDMTDYIPGGANGGVAPLAKETIKGLSEEKGDEIIILTTTANNQDLQKLESDKVKCKCIKIVENIAQAQPEQNEENHLINERISDINDNEDSDSSQQVKITAESVKRSEDKSLKTAVKAMTPKVIYNYAKQHKYGFLRAKAIMKHPLQHSVGAVYGRVKYSKAGKEVRKFIQKNKTKPTEVQINNVSLKDIIGESVDILYCPFTAINYWDESVKTVIQLNDIQHRFCPWFFDGQELEVRESFYRTISKLNPNVISISEYTKKTFIDEYGFDDHRITTVYPAIQDRFDSFPEDSLSKEFKLTELSANQYILYTANFWPHKNHKSLFMAFSIYKHAHPESGLKLVLTGFSSNNANEWKKEADRLGIGRDIVFLGYVSDIRLATLMKNCKLFVFPSLFEGFGIPIIEAMHLDASVICSNVTSLPEIAGDCALYFDPYDPYDIYNKIEYALNNPEEMNKKKLQYKKHLEKFTKEEFLSGLQRCFENLA